MRITRWSTLGLCVAGGAAVTYLAMALLEYTRSSFPAVSFSVGAVLIAGAVILVILGLPIRQFTHGTRKHVEPLRAARVLALAKACTTVGALLTGGYAVVTAMALGHLTSAVLQQRAWAGGFSLLGAVALTTAGMVVQYFCRIPPTSTDDAQRAGPGFSEPPQEANPA